MRSRILPESRHRLVARIRRVPCSSRRQRRNARTLARRDASEVIENADSREQRAVERLAIGTNVARALDAPARPVRYVADPDGPRRVDRVYAIDGQSGVAIALWLRPQ